MITKEKIKKEVQDKLDSLIEYTNDLNNIKDDDVKNDLDSATYFLDIWCKTSDIKEIIIKLNRIKYFK